jgi:fructose-1,6-bisphosphatase I
MNRKTGFYSADISSFHPERGITLERHLLQQQRQAGATGEFTALMGKIITAAKIVNAKVNMAGLTGVLGLTGETNVQGEHVQRLDVFANTVFKRYLSTGGTICLMASEEEEDIIRIPEPYPVGRYVVLFDPLDGSSNIDANVSIGTIFSVYVKASDSERGIREDCLQPGDEQVAAGYVIYGSSTMLVLTVGNGDVHGFTLDPTVGEFFLSHPAIRIPEEAELYSVNEGNAANWTEGTKNYIEHLKGEDQKYSLRYIGSMVADLHRNLLKGGIFLYPADKKNPNGKLRLGYEANPMAMVVENAGGLAYDGKVRIASIKPERLHQRTPLIIGSKKEVEKALTFMAKD